MRRLTSILCLVALFSATSLSAQVKKSTGVKKTVQVPQQKKVAKPVAQAAPSETKPQAVAPTQSDSKAETVVAEEPKIGSNAKQVLTDAPYKAAIGIKFMWGIAATGKYFFKKDQAVEAILRYRGYSGLGTDLAITALYQYEKPITEVQGLYWLVGAGPYFGHFSYKDNIYNLGYEGSGYSYYGIAAMAGLEYKFEKMPIAISADWMPAYDFNGGGFGAESGGFGIKYTF